MAQLRNMGTVFLKMNTYSQRFVFVAAEDDVIKLDFKTKNGKRGQIQLILEKSDFNHLKKHFSKTNFKN